MLRSQIVKYKDRFYRLVFGITMGLACSNQFANIYMLEFDDALKSITAQHLYFYTRFVDGTLLLLSQSIDVDAIFSSVNRWRDDIRCTMEVEDVDGRLPFLDLHLKFVEDVDGLHVLQSKTFRKK